MGFISAYRLIYEYFHPRLSLNFAIITNNLHWANPLHKLSRGRILLLFEIIKFSGVWGRTMKPIKNEYEDDLLLPSRFEKKYLKFVDDFSKRDTLADKVFDALRSKDIDKIEASMVILANSLRTNVLLIGLTCLVIEREKIYKKAGYNSYIEYSQTLFEKLEMSNQSISEAKIIMGAYIDHYKGLQKYNFRLERNAHKLKFIDEAISNHSNIDEVYNRAANSTFREFVDWARMSSKRKALPPPMPKVRIKDGKIVVNGKKYEDLPPVLQKTIEQDFVEIYAIRSGGNEPVVFSTYDQKEASLLRRKIETVLKQIRSKR